MKKILIFIVLLFSNVTYSQVNIESFRNNAKDYGFFGEVKSNIQYQKGNVDSQVYEIKKDLHYKKNKNHILLKSSYVKGYQSKKSFKNSAFAHFRYTVMYHDFLGYEIFTQTQFDEFRDLTLRQLNGGGIRLEKASENKKLLKMSLGLGLMSDHEQLSYETTTKARLTSYLTITKSFSKNNSSFISVVTYYQPLLFNHNDYRVTSEITIRSSIIDNKSYNIGLDTSLNYLYDTAPAEKIENTDLLIKSGIVLNW